MIRTSSSAWPPPKYRRKLYRWILNLRQRLVREIEISDDAGVYRFRCGTVRELNRCMSLFKKEPGTVHWIRADFHPGQVFFDIGANIGAYTMQAARRLAPGGTIYAFEPHGPNFARLIDNIQCNDLQDTVTPVSAALHCTSGYFSFRYDSVGAGTSNSQLAAGSGAKTMRGAVTELKQAITVDDLIGSGRAAAPHHVKIDVDGNEYLILQGMSGLLSSPQAPLTLQVELNGVDAEPISDYLSRFGYHLADIHSSRAPDKQPQATGQCNGLFRKQP